MASVETRAAGVVFVLSVDVVVLLIFVFIHWFSILGAVVIILPIFYYYYY